MSSASSSSSTTTPPHHGITCILFEAPDELDAKCALCGGTFKDTEKTHVVLIAESLQGKAKQQQQPQKKYPQRTAAMYGIKVGFVGPQHASSETGWRLQSMHEACAKKFEEEVPDKHAEQRLIKLLEQVDDDQHDLYTNILVDYFHDKCEPTGIAVCPQSFQGNTQDVGYLMDFPMKPTNIHWHMCSEIPWPFLISYAALVLEVKISCDKELSKMPATCNEISVLGNIAEDITKAKIKGALIGLLEWKQTSPQTVEAVVACLLIEVKPTNKTSIVDATQSTFLIPSSEPELKSLHQSKKVIEDIWAQTTKVEKWSYTKTSYNFALSPGVEYQDKTLLCNVAPVVPTPVDVSQSKLNRRVRFSLASYPKDVKLQAFAAFEAKGLKQPPPILYSALTSSSSTTTPGLVRLKEIV